jgi:beta-glucuronidase
MPRRRVEWGPAAAWAVVLLVTAGAAVALLVHRHRDTFPVPAQASGPVGIVPLDSGWRYRVDPRDVGVKEHWQELPPRGRHVTLPWVPNAYPVSGPRGQRNYAGSVGWYSTRFQVRRQGHYTIHFASVSHYATVWLDGRRLGSHVGAYDPFEMRVRLPSRSAHVLTVRADWRFPELQRKRGWNRAWFNFGGINRPVTLERLGYSEPAQPRIWTHLVRVPGGGRAALVSVQVRVRNNSVRRPIPVVGSLRRGRQRVRIRFERVEVGTHRTHLFEGSANVVDPALWSPGRPSLYELEVAVPGESAVRQRVGLRELSRRAGRLYLNGNRIVLRGASIPPDVRGHGDAFTAADRERVVRELKQIGANATRAQQRLDPAMLARLDAAGIMVWQEIGPFDTAGDWTSDTPALQRRARQRAIDAFAELQSHPSIVAWSLGNEVAGQGHPGGQVEHILSLTRQLHELDPGRLVAVDLWGRHGPHYAGPLYTDLDAIGFTDYHGWYESPGATGPVLRDLIARRVANLRAIFPDKVLAVTEFGAAANGHNQPAALGGTAYQADVIAQHISTYRGLPDLSGMLVWSLRDYALTPAFTGGSFARIASGVRLTTGLNEKGLFDYAGRAKPAVAIARRAFHGWRRP